MTIAFPLDVAVFPIPNSKWHLFSIQMGHMVSFCLRYPSPFYGTEAVTPHNSPRNDYRFTANEQDEKERRNVRDDDERTKRQKTSSIDSLSSLSVVLGSSGQLSVAQSLQERHARMEGMPGA